MDPGSLIWVIPAYTLTIAGAGENAAATGDLDVTANLTLTGADAATTVIDGGLLDRVIDVRSSASLTISNVTITNGALVGDNGGGLGHNSSGVTTLDSSIVKNSSTTSFGGGISNNSSVGTVNIIDSTVTNNNSNSFGGGVNNNSGGTINVTNSTVSDNNAGGFGGGINNNSFKGLLTSSTALCRVITPTAGAVASTTTQAAQ